VACPESVSPVGFPVYPAGKDFLASLACQDFPAYWGFEGCRAFPGLWAYQACPDPWGFRGSLDYSEGCLAGCLAAYPVGYLALWGCRVFEGWEIRVGPAQLRCLQQSPWRLRTGEIVAS
jgi:hypothetical protein